MPLRAVIRLPSTLLIDSVEKVLSHDIPFAITSYPVLISTDLSTPLNLSVVDEEAFMGVACASIRLSEKTTRIRDRAFADCPNLHKIYIPDGVVILRSI